ncbi:bacillithiol system protein YtxJ [Fodinibius salinus]|uniref:Bacillithiol system protein YtxJ n=1 Tax=Fodinibius salinus TaxID=860790 RepID=A0A5D3YIX2_9BACT|nr:bacillithiol system redox-active protein YtxJ [Fodinibius salinus]TYP92685.1 bacillithiol system protein YtxJ [Fodinibius salinus]
MGLFDAISNTFSGSSDDIWDTISQPSDLESIVDKSGNRPQLIYKHSNRCSVCFVAKGNLEQSSKQLLEHADMHYLNVVKNRSASDSVASKLNVRHESPQVILLDEGEVVWHASHGKIEGSKILEQLS